MPRHNETFWLAIAKSVLATLLVAAILGTAGAAASIWLEVKMLRRDVDEVRKDVDRLWTDVSKNVAALETEAPLPGLRPTSTQMKMAEAAAALAERPAAAAPAAVEASPPPN